MDKSNIDEAFKSATAAGTRAVRSKAGQLIMKQFSPGVMQNKFNGDGKIYANNLQASASAPGNLIAGNNFPGKTREIQDYPNMFLLITCDEGSMTPKEIADFFNSTCTEYVAKFGDISEDDLKKIGTAPKSVSDKRLCDFYYLDLTEQEKELNGGVEVKSGLGDKVKKAFAEFLKSSDGQGLEKIIEVHGTDGDETGKFATGLEPGRYLVLTAQKDVFDEDGIAHLASDLNRNQMKGELKDGDFTEGDVKKAEPASGYSGKDVFAIKLGGQENLKESEMDLSAKVEKAFGEIVAGNSELKYYAEADASVSGGYLEISSEKGYMETDGAALLANDINDGTGGALSEREFTPDDAEVSDGADGERDIFRFKL